MRPFERFGLEHWLALALIAATAVGLVRLLRREPRSAAVDNVVRLGLAAFLLVGLLIALVDALPLRGLDWIDIQVMTPHMERLGARNLARREFLELLRRTRARGLALFAPRA